MVNSFLICAFSTPFMRFERGIEAPRSEVKRASPTSKQPARAQPVPALRLGRAEEMTF
jgi:hypothetical protein